MTTSQYKNKIDWTLTCNDGVDLSDSYAVVKTILANCGVPFPTGGRENALEVLSGGDEDILPGLSACVRAAVEPAVAALHALVPLLLADPGAPAAALGRSMESGPAHPAALPAHAAGTAEDR